MNVDILNSYYKSFNVGIKMLSNEIKFKLTKEQKETLKFYAINDF